MSSVSETGLMQVDCRVSSEVNFGFAALATARSPRKESADRVMMSVCALFQMIL